MIHFLWAGHLDPDHSEYCLWNYVIRARTFILGKYYKSGFFQCDGPVKMPWHDIILYAVWKLFREYWAIVRESVYLGIITSNFFLWQKKVIWINQYCQTRYTNEYTNSEQQQGSAFLQHTKNWKQKAKYYIFYSWLLNHTGKTCTLVTKVLSNWPKSFSFGVFIWL